MGFTGRGKTLAPERVKPVKPYTAGSNYGFGGIEPRTVWLLGGVL